MTALIDQAIGLSVVLLGVLGAAWALRRRSAAIRHWVIAAGVLSALTLPVARLLVPHWAVAEPPSSIALANGAITVAPAGAPPSGHARGADGIPPSHSRRIPAADALLAAWGLGAAASLAVLLAGVCRLAWHGRHGRRIETGAWRRAADRICAEMGFERPVSIVETSSPSMLGAWGWRKPIVLIPCGAERWPAVDVDVVLRHELAHVARDDWSIQLTAEVLRTAHWFNPLAWVACARLRLESERACDDVVLGAGLRGDEYAEQLLNLAARLRRPGARWATFLAAGMARPTSLQRRVIAMLDPALCRTTVTPRTRIAIAACALVFTLPVAGVAVFARAQEHLSGSILDQSGKNIPDVRIVLTQEQTKMRRELRSDGQGRFEFDNLPAGDYAVEVSLPGFKTMKGTVTVAPGGATRDIYLQLGSVRETIVISAKSAGTAAPAAKPAMPREPPQRPACGTTPLGGNVRAPLKLTDVKPDYPEALSSAKVSGTVVLEGILSGDGTVRGIRVVESPHPDLGRSVVDAVGKWRFTPTLLNCQPADIGIAVTAKFVLE